MTIENYHMTGQLDTTEADELIHIHASSYNIGVWQRTPPKDNGLFTALLSANPEKLVLLCNYKKAGKSVRKHISRYIDSSVLKNAAPFFEDVQHLADIFHEITGSDDMRLYFSVVNTNMCRRFHTDINDLRLLCTYYGPGTLWLKNNDIQESVLDAAMAKPELIPASEIGQAAPGDVVLLKGALHPTAGQYGAILHRSPVVEDTGCQRILLRLDTNIYSFG